MTLTIGVQRGLGACFTAFKKTIRFIFLRDIVSTANTQFPQGAGGGGGEGGVCESNVLAS